MSRLTHVRAPEEHGAVVCDPAPQRWRHLLTSNLQRFAQVPAGTASSAVLLWRGLMRRQMVSLAQVFHRQWGLPWPNHVRADKPILIVGHQPELFHPGVWAKYFAGAGFARSYGATLVSVIMDTDVLRSRSVLVPRYADGRWEPVYVHYDAPAPEQPHELCRLHDVDCFVSFAERVSKCLGEKSWQPVVEDFWPAAVDRASPGAVVGHLLACARHMLESQWGYGGLEIPLSVLVHSEPFCRFAASILDDLPRFYETFNSLLRQFRSTWRVRSKTHPVPDLSRQGDALEAPFWALWEKRGRQRFFLRLAPQCIEWVSERGDVFLRSPRGDALIAELVHRCAGEKPIPHTAWEDDRFLGIRPRATTATLFLRIYLADLFVHGIGGAFYDRFTDELIRCYYGFEPPAFVVVSGTWRLPLCQEAPPAQVHALRQRRRYAYCNPHLFLEPSPSDASLQSLVQKRRDLVLAIEHSTRRDERASLHRHIHELNRILREYLGGFFEEMDRLIAQNEEKLRLRQFLCSREFSFVLHPRQDIRQAMTQLGRMWSRAE